MPCEAASEASATGVTGGTSVPGSRLAVAWKVSETRGAAGCAMMTCEVAGGR